MPPRAVCGILLRWLGLGLELGHASHAITSFAPMEAGERR